MLRVHSKQAQSQGKDNPQFIQSHAARKFSFQLASSYELHLKISVGKRTEAKVYWWQADQHGSHRFDHKVVQKCHC